jgi:hypothetical protein
MAVLVLPSYFMEPQPLSSLDILRATAKLDSDQGLQIQRRLYSYWEFGYGINLGTEKDGWQ